MNTEYTIESANENSPEELLLSSQINKVAGKLLVLIVAILMAIGIVSVYSSQAGLAVTKNSSFEYYFLWRQLIFSFLGIATVLFVAQLDYHIFWKTSKIILFASILLLTLLLVMKAVGLIVGTSRWLGVGFLKFQVSDSAKYAIIFHLSRLISEKQGYIKDLHNSYYPMLVLLMTVVSLVALEPNFSTASLIALIGFTLMFIGGVNIRHLMTTMTLLITSAAFFTITGQYRLAAFLSFISEVISGGDINFNYQASQTLSGLRSGGIFGIGLAVGNLKNSLPLSYNDFVFVIITKYYGFVGALLIIILYMGFFLCGLIIAKHASDNFGKCVASGITFCITVWALVNILGTFHVIPAVYGINLPFISYGGTNLLFESVGVGILVNISRGDCLDDRMSMLLSQAIKRSKYLITKK